ncbi:hypothetical protein BSK59_13300 [Paenibacillus odorifer]|uniref:hypothetical protein n=1 Tax=Paenibacillus odorifer TaxID=189426 RepID=UPI00096FDEEF|nr:hypothetical protein [Paenibacillus odorifer]OME55448.1 hypothetical protein BSK59_13300 [Paenibacillus odorifer]
MENIVRQALGREGRGSIVVNDAGFVGTAGGAFSAIVAALSPYFLNASYQRQEAIRELIEKYLGFSGTVASDADMGSMVADL